MEKFKKGQQVKIVSHEHTDRTYGMSDQMFELIDTIQTVKSADSTSVYIKGCYWKHEDLRPVEFKEKDPQVFHFDPANLEI